MERIAQPAADRLAVIAGEEKLTERITVTEGAVQRLMQGLRQRYNYVVADIPLGPMGWYGEVLDQARQRVLVMEPTLQAVRDTLRVMALPMGAQQIRQPVVVLNKLGAPGTMTQRQVEVRAATQGGGRHSLPTQDRQSGCHHGHARGRRTKPLPHCHS